MKLNKVLTTIGIASIVGISAVGVIVSSAKDQDLQISVLNSIQQEQVEVLSDFDFRITELRNNGILIGDEKGNLNLDSTLKRQEMIVLLSRLMGKEAEAKKWNTSNLTFADVQKDNWAAPYIAWAKDNNITKGYSEEKFGYDDTLTERHTAMFLLRVLGYEVEEKEAENLAAKTGILDGVKNTQKEEIIRSDVAIMIYNTLNAEYDAETGKTLGEMLEIQSEYTKEEKKLKLSLEYYKVDMLKKIDVTDNWVYIYTDTSKSNLSKKDEEEYKAFIHTIISVVGYKDIRVIDEINDLDIIAYCDNENSRVLSLEVNGVYNYFNMKETF